MNTVIQILGQLFIAIVFMALAALIVIETTFSLNATERLSTNLVGLDNQSLTTFGRFWRMCLLPFVAITIDLSFKTCLVLAIVSYDYNRH